MEIREQVFISSTYIDLKEERNKVIQGLLEADCFPAGMETFPASDDDKWDLIKGVIDDSDYYLLIIGARYGAEDGETQLSYTEKEYDYAVEQGKPVMAFVHGDPGSIAADKTDQNDAKREKLDAFRAKVQSRMVKMWKNGDELPGFVAQALMKLRKRRPAVGWVRGNHAMTPEVELEISELKREVNSLKSELAAKSGTPRIAPDLAEGDDEVELQVFIDIFAKADDDGEASRQKGNWDVTVTWDHILFDIGPALFQELEEVEMKNKLQVMCARELWTDRNGPHGLTKINSVSLLDDEFRTVLVQFRALNYIEKGVQRRPPSDGGRYWVLTDEGADRLMKLRAIRRSIPKVEQPEAASAQP